MTEGDMVYFIYEENLYIGKIIKSIGQDKLKILTYTTQETHLELHQNELYSSLNEGDQYLQKVYPNTEIDIHKLMDIARFLEF